MTQQHPWHDRIVALEAQNAAQAQDITALKLGQDSLSQALAGLAGTFATDQARQDAAIAELQQPQRRGTMFAHMAAPTYDNLLARAGWANGAALYGAQGDEFTAKRLEQFIGHETPVPIYAMPKTMSDDNIAAIRAALTYDELGALLVTNGQEPEGDTQWKTPEQQAAHRAQTIRYLNGFAGTPAKVGVHLQAWTTAPNGPNDPDLLRAFLPTVERDGAVVDFVGCSLYLHKPAFGATRTLLAAFLDAVRGTEGYGGVPVMVTAWGVAVPGKGATQQQRDTRAAVTKEGLAVIAELCPDQPVGWFDMKWPLKEPVYDYVVADDPALTVALTQGA